MVSVETVSGVSKFSLVKDPDGSVGTIVIFSKLTGQPIGTITTTDTSLVVQNVAGTSTTVPRDEAGEKPAVDLIYQAYQDKLRRGDLDIDGNSDSNIRKASFDSSGISENINPADPLQSLEANTVNIVVPLGGPQGEAALPEGNEAAVDIPIETGGETTTDVIEQVVPIPVLGLPQLTPIVGEDGSVTITGFTLSSHNNLPLSVTIVAQSTITLASTDGLAFAEGDGVGDERMMFEGLPADVQAALEGLTYFPTPNNDGDGGITIVLDDGTFVVAATLNVDITPVPDAPIARDDKFDAFEGVTLIGDVTADNGNGPDEEPDAGDSFTITQVNGDPEALGEAVVLPSGGVVTLQSDGTFRYQPPDGASVNDIFNDSFTYTIEDTTGRTGTATVRFDVSGVNDPPTVDAPLADAAMEDAPVFRIDLLDGASDPDVGDVLNVANVTGLAPGITLDGNELVVDPSDDAFQGLSDGASFMTVVGYDIVDGNGGTVPQTAKVTISGKNDDPKVAAQLMETAAEDSAVFQIDLLEGASDAEGDTLSVANVSGLGPGMSIVREYADRRPVGRRIPGAGPGRFSCLDRGIRHRGRQWRFGVSRGQGHNHG